MNAYWTIPVLAVIAGCTDTQVPAPPANTGPTVYAVNYPLQYMARRIGGDVIDVVFPCPAGVDPAHWRPDDATVEACQGADLILLNGADYARWTRAASLPPSRLVDTSASFRDDYIETERGLTHGHGPDGEHTHGRIAFTTWFPTDEHRRADDGFHQGRAVELRTLAVEAPGKEEAQDSFSHEQFQERREVCDGVLEASVLMNQLWRDDSGFRGFVHKSTERFHASVHELRVVVEDEDVPGLRGFHRLVDRDGESAVPFVPEDADVRELLPDPIGRAVGGGIVDEDDLPLSDGLEARDRQVDPVEAGHDDG